MIKAFPGFLVFFVLLTPLDDALASATPGHADDILATQNNDYLSRPRDQARSPVRDQMPLAGPTAALAPLPVPDAVPQALRPGMDPGSFAGRDPLYDLMSLQR